MANPDEMNSELPQLIPNPPKGGRSIVTFQGPFNKPAHTELVLTNKNSRPIAYKVKSNQVDYFKITPRGVGCLRPEEQTTIQFTVSPGASMLPCKLLLQSVFITEDAADAIGMEIMDAAELWYMPEIATETMMNTPIEVIFEEPSQHSADSHENVLDQLTTVWLDRGDQTQIFRAEHESSLGLRHLQSDDSADEPPAPTESAVEAPACTERSTEAPAPTEKAAEATACTETVPEAPAPVAKAAESPATALGRDLVEAIRHLWNLQKEKRHPMLLLMLISVVAGLVLGLWMY